MNAKPKNGDWKFPLYWVASVGSSLLLFSTVVLLGWAAYHGSQNALLAVTEESVSHINGSLEQRLRGVLEPADDQLRLLLYSGLATGHTLKKRLAVLPEVFQALKDNPLIDALYAGYSNGEFVLFRRLRDTVAARRFEAPPGAAMLVQTISVANDESVRGEYRFYDKDYRLLTTIFRPDYHYDPRTRPWYRNALEKDYTVLTEPYLFFTTPSVGITLTHRTFDRDAVIGLDVTLESLANVFRSLRITPSTEVALVDQRQQVLAYSDASRVVRRQNDGQLRLAQLAELNVPPLSRAATLMKTGLNAESADIDGRGWHLVAHPVKGSQSYPIEALIGIPKDELFVDARNILNSQVLLALVILVLSMPFGWWLTQRLTRPLQRLVEDAKAIEAFDFTPRPLVASHITEVDRLATATRRMSNTIANFLDTSVALSSETHIERLLKIILHNTLSAVEARCGAVYLVSEASLLKAREATAPGAEAKVFPERLAWDDLESIAVQAWREHRLHASSDGDVAAPLLTRDGSFVGVMLITIDPGSSLQGELESSDPRIGFIRALSAIAAVAIETRKLIEQQKILLESFIKLIATAIDAKSPYTGGHCQRVPELAKMLAHAAHDAQEGHFEHFHLSEQEWEALHIGAWLHDCGKVTTPEYVVDKATKLETIYDRIHEVRMRFEVLKRDAEIASLKSKIFGAEVTAADAALQASLQELDEEFAFVAACNLGTETMAPARIERLKTIAARTWQRTLDDRLGISWAELERCEANSAPQMLPVEEKLLADKPEHLIARPDYERFEPDNKWGFKMEVPEYKANLGELYNLSISRGTLTTEERYRINHHIIQTIVMLDTLPFPRELGSVPEIAGGHHERMDGKGYPRRLKGKEMSTLARIMAIADVFEALTASDRPYRRANTLSQAVSIMANMVRDQHLDSELFRLFLESGIYRVYGARFLSASQCDDVDIAAALVAAGLEEEETVLEEEATV